MGNKQSSSARKPEPDERRGERRGERGDEAINNEESSRKRYKADIVEFDVGGQVFKTSCETVLQYKSPCFARLLQDDDQEDPNLGIRGAQRDKAGRLFIDRSPDLFKLILEYMRGSLDVHSLTKKERNSLRSEAAYYALDGLVDELRPESGKGYDPKALCLEDQEIRQQAQQIRKDLADADPKAPAEADAVLIDLFGGGTRKFSGRYDEPFQSSGLPLLFENQANYARSKVTVNMSPASSLDEFKRRLEAYAGPLFRNFPMENLVVAGGSVLRALMGTTEQTKTGDVDLFLVATDEGTSRAAYDRILQHFAQHRQGSNIMHNQLLVVRSTFAVSFVIAYPQRNIQLILRRHSCIADVIFNFDIDCCQVAWDGSRVLATPSAYRALCAGINIADPERSSPKYELRLRKYASRGFIVAVPGLDLSRVKAKYVGQNVFTVDAMDGKLKHVTLDFSGEEDLPTTNIDPREITGLSKLIVCSGLFMPDQHEFGRAEELGALQDFFVGDRVLPSDSYLINAGLLARGRGIWKRPTPPNPPPFYFIMDFDNDIYDAYGGGPLLPFASDLSTPFEVLQHLLGRLSREEEELREEENVAFCYQLSDNVLVSVAFPVILDAAIQFPNAEFGTERGKFKRRLEFPPSSRTATNPWIRLPESDWTVGTYAESTN